MFPDEVGDRNECDRDRAGLVEADLHTESQACVAVRVAFEQSSDRSAHVTSRRCAHAEAPWLCRSPEVEGARGYQSRVVPRHTPNDTYGRAEALGRRQRPRSARSQHKMINSPARAAYVRDAPVAQLDRASDFESEGRGFDSLQAHIKRLSVG